MPRCLAQIDGHGLPASDGQHRLFLDFPLQAIDLRIGRDHPLGLIHILLDQGIDGIGNLLLDQPAHLHDLA